MSVIKNMHYAAEAVVRNGMFLYGEAMDVVIHYHDVELKD